VASIDHYSFLNISRNTGLIY